MECVGGCAHAHSHNIYIDSTQYWLYLLCTHKCTAVYVQCMRVRTLHCQKKVQRDGLLWDAFYSSMHFFLFLNQSQLICHHFVSISVCMWGRGVNLIYMYYQVMYVVLCSCVWCGSQNILVKDKKTQMALLWKIALQPPVLAEFFLANLHCQLVAFSYLRRKS